MAPIEIFIKREEWVVRSPNKLKALFPIPLTVKAMKAVI